MTETPKPEKETKLNWMEKIAVRRLIKKTKRDLDKELFKAAQNNEMKQELKKRVIKSILDMKEHFDITINKHNEQEQEILNKGRPIETEATQQELQNLPIEKLIETYQQIITELQRVMGETEE